MSLIFHLGCDAICISCPDIDSFVINHIFNLIILNINIFLYTIHKRERSSNGYINQFNGFCLSVCRYDVGRSTPGTFRNRNVFFRMNAIFLFLREYIFFDSLTVRRAIFRGTSTSNSIFVDSLNRNRPHLLSGDTTYGSLDGVSRFSRTARRLRAGIQTLGDALAAILEGVVGKHVERLLKLSSVAYLTKTIVLGLNSSECRVLFAQDDEKSWMLGFCFCRSKSSAGDFLFFCKIAYV